MVPRTPVVAVVCLVAILGWVSPVRAQGGGLGRLPGMSPSPAPATGGGGELRGRAPSTGPLAGVGPVIDPTAPSYARGTLFGRGTYGVERFDGGSGLGGSIDIERELTRYEVGLGIGMGKNIELGFTYPFEEIDPEGDADPVYGTTTADDFGDLRLGLKASGAPGPFRMAVYTLWTVPTGGDDLEGGEIGVLPRASTEDELGTEWGLSVSQAISVVHVMGNVSWLRPSEEVDALGYRAALGVEPIPSLRIAAWWDGFEMEGSVDSSGAAGASVQLILSGLGLVGDVSGRYHVLGDAERQLGKPDYEFWAVSAAAGLTF